MARRLEFFTLEWLLDIIVKSFVLIVIILFQADIRRLLSRMGKKALAPGGEQLPETTVKKSAPRRKPWPGAASGPCSPWNAITASPSTWRGLSSLDALVTKELLISLFWPHTPTHDGAVVIQRDRVAGAGCLLPLSKNPDLEPTLGTRHRAAVGLTEQSDAVALVVSETTGQISLAQGGKLRQNLNPAEARRVLQRSDGNSQ